jgi:hypothetical protein
VRLDLFGDMLDGARRFDAVTQRTTETLQRVELAPVSEVILDEAAITRFRQNYRIEFGAAGTDDPLYEAVSAGRKHQGRSIGCRSSTNGWKRSSTTCRAPTVTLDDQTTPQRIARWEAIADQYDTRATALSQKGRLDTVYKPVPPGQLYLDEAAWDAALGDGAWCSSRRCAVARARRDRRGRARGPRFRAGTAEREPQPFRRLGGSSSRACGPSGRGHRLLVRRRAGTSEGPSGGPGVERPAPDRQRARYGGGRICRQIRHGKRAFSAPAPPGRLAAGTGLHGGRARRHLRTGRSGRPADQAAPQDAPGRELT